MVKQYYIDNIKNITDRIGKITSNFRMIAVLRLISFLLIIFLVTRLVKNNQWYYWIILFTCIFSFLFLIKYFIKLKEKKLFYEKLLKINKDELEGLNNNYGQFEDGEEFINPEHSYSYDLDIFGKGSLFQTINRTVTHNGKVKLSDYFLNPDIDKHVIESKQKAIVELSTLGDWRQNFAAKGMMIEESKTDLEHISNWLNSSSRFHTNKFYKVVSIWLPIISIVSWALFGFKVITSALPVSLFFVQLILTAFNVKYVNSKQNLIYNRVKILKKMFSLVVEIENKEFKSETLLSTRQRIFISEKKPSLFFSKLIRYLDALDNRMNILLAVILNGIFLWDINCMIRIEKWKTDFKDIFPEWIEAISEIDALSSLAGFQFNNPNYVIPNINPGPEFKLEIKEGRHPLIKDKDSIPNDISQEGHPNILLITGANMAGKSTFLRTVGINMLLANMGACVCAKNMDYTPVNIYTSMRASDSIQRHTSYFFAELKRLKFIVEKLSEGKPSYILLDEILKGTNSKDQHSGSYNLIENVIKLNGVGLIATHDLELSKLNLKYPDKIKNIAFEIDIEDEKMHFSYKYKEGVCKNMNATFLMKKMEIF
jgi:DNA mismatch repair ATPase MutS